MMVGEVPESTLEPELTVLLLERDEAVGVGRADRPIRDKPVRRAVTGKFLRSFSVAANPGP